MAGCIQTLKMNWRKANASHRPVFVEFWRLPFSFFYSARFQVTGVFCQSAIDSAQNDHATVVQSILANKEMHIQKIRKLFSRFDQQETGVITFAMLEEKLDSSEVREYQKECIRYLYICHVYFQMVCQKLCQNSVSGWGTLEDSNFDRRHCETGRFQPVWRCRQVHSETRTIHQYMIINMQ